MTNIMKLLKYPFAILCTTSSVTLAHAKNQRGCDLNSIQMPPSQSDNDHPRAQVFGDDNYIQRCEDAGGDVISFSGRTICEGIEAFPYDRTDRNWPLCVPPSCTEDDLEEAIAQQLFGDELWGDWVGGEEANCTGSYEFEGMGNGHSDVLQCFFDAQDNYDPVMKSFDQYQDEMKEDPVRHTLSLEELKKLCYESGMDYFEGSWDFICNENTKYAVVLQETNLPRCLPKSCTVGGEFILVENWYNLNFARQASICKMVDYSFTGLDESTSGNAPQISTSPAASKNVRNTYVWTLMAVASWSVVSLFGVVK